jgi:hypothetical protein
VDSEHRNVRLAAGALVVASAALVTLSVVDGWVIHVRHQGGHGLTAITAVWNAWQGRAWPILPLAMAAAALAALLGGIEVVRPGRLPRWPRLTAASACLAFLVASSLPLEHAGHASRVEVTAGWPLYVGIGLSLLMVLAALLPLSPPSPRGLALAGGAAGVLLALAVGGRVLALDLAEGDARSYSAGTYVRPASDGVPAATLRLGEGTYELNGRWSGTLSGRGLVVVLTGDPACPDARGSYRIFPVGEDDIRWNTIVDLCSGGDRASDLTTGVWERQP